MTLQELADTAGLAFKGDPRCEIKGVRDIEALRPDQELAEGFVYFVESQAVLKRHPLAPGRAVILTTTSLAGAFPNALIAADGRGRLALIALLKAFDKTPSFSPAVSAQAFVHQSAKIGTSTAVLAGASVMCGAVIGERCLIYPGVVVEPFASIGDDTVIYPNAVIGHHCRVGSRVVIHGGTVIGADGFGFYDDAGTRHKMPQIGDVVIADDVEIGASCTIDRATIESTTIGAHTKLDDQVHVGHNCRVGAYVYIVGNTAIGGSVVIGDAAMLSGMVIVKDHVKIAPGSIVMGMTAIAQDTEPKTAYFGIPARPARQMHKMNAALERLPELLARVRALEDKLESPAYERQARYDAP